MIAQEPVKKAAPVPVKFNAWSKTLPRWLNKSAMPVNPTAPVRAPQLQMDLG